MDEQNSTTSTSPYADRDSSSQLGRGPTKSDLSEFPVGFSSIYKSNSATSSDPTVAVGETSLLYFTGKLSMLKNTVRLFRSRIHKLPRLGGPESR